MSCQAAEKLADKFVEDFIQLGVDTAERRAKGEDDGEHVPTSAYVLVFGSEGAEKGEGPLKEAAQAEEKAQEKARLKNCSESPVKTNSNSI